LDRLELYLKGDGHQYYFNELEDMILRKNQTDSDEIKLLFRVKGKETVLERM
jgi:hypothetical protein